MKKAKQTLSILLAALMLLTAVPLTTLAANDYLMYLLPSDIQAYEGTNELTHNGNCNSAYSHRISNVYLAKNEYEGFQAYFYEAGEPRQIRLTVEEFKNGNGEILPHTLYNEAYFAPAGVSATHFADALVPYSGESVTTKNCDNVTFYVELHSAKDQTPGNYTSVVTFYEGDKVIDTRSITATVWNFTLPDSHYSSSLMGLYNSNSGYAATRGFLELSGVRFQNGEIVEEDKALAEEILEGWDDFLLEHGVESYELPRFLIDTDEKEALLAMADPRRNIFCVPLLSRTVSGGSLTATAKAKVEQYKNLIKGNQLLEDKALFYPADEPNWSSEADTAGYEALLAAIRDAWGGDFHSVVPFYSSSSYTVSELEKTSDVICANQDAVVKNDTVFDSFAKDTWYKKLRYQGDVQLGCTYLHRWGKSTMGIFARILYWQDAVLGGNGILHWNCAYCPIVDGKPYNPWDTMELTNKGETTGNGDGIFLYPSAPLGLDPTTPIASLRLKHISNGMDDFDYLQLAKETFGEDSTEYKTAINSVFGQYEANGAHHIFASERSPYNSNIVYEWVAWDANIMNGARIALGNALSGNADDAHDYGDWQTITEKDATHNGLKIRVCENCGAQESEYDYVCGEKNHSFKIKQNDSTTHKKVCEYCKKTELVAHSETTIPAVEATCVKGGSTAGVKCSECGYIITAPGKTAVNPKNHAWDGGKQTKAPTCKEAGVKTFTCTRVGCGATKTESIAKTAHKYTAKVVPASCETEGYSLHTCSVCGNSYKDNTVKATGHQYENGICRVCKKACSCMCHKGGFYSFLWKIVIFFCKIFGQRKMCECGITHY